MQDDLADLLLPADARFASVEVDETEVSLLDPLLPGERPAAHSACAPKREREFRAGRHVARRVLQELGVKAGPLYRDADGAPVFPTGVAASITHTGTSRTFAAAAGSPRARGLGLDAEQVRAFSEELLARVVNPDEKRQLARSGEAQTLAVLAFSAKEAFYKCVFPTTRKRLGFHDVFFQLEELRQCSNRHSGAFALRSTVCQMQGGPPQLHGKFVLTPHKVLTAVVWPR